MIPRRPFFDCLYNCNHANYAREGFLASRAAELVNPRHRTILADTVWQDFDAETLAGMNDAKILSLFTSGFFGGFVFGIEGALLGAGAWRILPVHFTSMFLIPNLPSSCGLSDFSLDFLQQPQTPELWSSSEVPDNHVCDVGTRLFGAFQLLDKQISESSDSGLSYLDYGFGSDNYSFAGCHRFSVTRHHATSEEQSRIRISLEGFTCNPRENKSPASEVGKWFHALYARALFANAVQAIVESTRQNV